MNYGSFYIFSVIIFIYLFVFYSEIYDVTFRFTTYEKPYNIFHLPNDFEQLHYRNSWKRISLDCSDAMLPQ